MDRATHETGSVGGMTEDEISARLETRPDLLDRFKAGDLSAFAELVEVGTGAKVKRMTVTFKATGG